LVEFYFGERTRASLQGSNDLKTRVRSVLGIPRSQVADAQLEALDPFFTARNKIVHDMDYKDVGGASIARVHRQRDHVVAMCDGVFGLASAVLSATAVVLREAKQ
jgi:transcriptional regulator GlxA family with amidase domain